MNVLASFCVFDGSFKVSINRLGPGLRDDDLRNQPEILWGYAQYHEKQNALKMAMLDQVLLIKIFLCLSNVGQLRVMSFSECPVWYCIK